MEKKVIDYKIVVNGILPTAEEEVKFLMKTGWQPKGEMKLGSSGSSIHYFQTMVMYEPESAEEAIQRFLQDNK